MSVDVGEMSSSLADQLAALKVVDTELRTLIISVGKKNDLKSVEERINRDTFEENPSVKLLRKADGSPLYPLVSVTEQNCLRLESLNAATAQQIVAPFPRITELIFINWQRTEEYQGLVVMLQSDQWRNRLTSLRLILAGVDCNKSRDEALFPAINGLTALRKLTLYLGGGFKEFDLQILAQLEEVRYGDSIIKPLIQSLKQYAAYNGQLRVDLRTGDYMMKELTDLSDSLRRTITRLDKDDLCGGDYHLSTLIPRFASLTSLSLNHRPWHCRPIFAAIASSLHQLVHLRLLIDFLGAFDFHNETPHGSDDEYDSDYSDYNGEDWHEKRPFRPPRAQLKSVKALELWVAGYHADIEWLNLPVTMPNLQAITLGVGYCRNCRVKYWKLGGMEEGDSGKLRPYQRKCLRAVFGILQRTGVSPSQMSYLGERRLGSVEELLNE